MAAVHQLPLDANTLHGHFSRDLAPVLEVEPGDTVVLSTLESGWSVDPVPPMSLTPPGVPAAPPPRVRHPAWTPDAGHALTGPIRVRGAVPGTTLAVHLEEIVPGSWGCTFAGGWPSLPNEQYGLTAAGVVHAWELDVPAGRGRNQHGHEVALRPFLGVVGLAPSAAGRHSTIPPRSCGGNLDCTELVAGSVLRLPVQVDGGLLSVGDGHGRQGDGEVGGTAIECPMDRVRLRLEVEDDVPVPGPWAQTPIGLVTLGTGATLDEAAYRALAAVHDLMCARFGLTRADAVALSSVVVDLRVTQIVNQVVGVHAVLPNDAVRLGSVAGASAGAGD
jgi:acetamidase/formamidase